VPNDGRLRPVKATSSGTRYHKETVNYKMWYEAKTEAGVTYYWHVETNGAFPLSNCTVLKLTFFFLV
jgi:hypothetical protein